MENYVSILFLDQAFTCSKLNRSPHLRRLGGMSDSVAIQRDEVQVSSMYSQSYSMSSHANHHDPFLFLTNSRSIFIPLLFRLSRTFSNVASKRSPKPPLSRSGMKPRTNHLFNIQLGSLPSASTNQKHQFMHQKVRSLW